MKLYVGLAYSNIQNKYNIPCIVAGIIIDANHLNAMEKEKLELKDRIVRHKYSLAELQEELDAIYAYLDKFVIITIQDVKGRIDVVSNTYFEAVKSLLGYHFPLINEGIVISYRKIVEIPGFDSKDIAATVCEKLQSLAQKVEAKEDENDYPTQIARLLARLEYERTRLVNSQFLTRALVRTPRKYLQFYKMSYQRTPPEDYVDNFVSFPEFVLRKPEKGVYRLPIVANSTFVDFQPIARFCLGTQKNGWVKPCDGSSEEQPYGSLVYGGYEKCNVCRNKEIYVECLKRKPSCNGTAVSCGNKYFAGEICNGAFGLYVTRFEDFLKVGQAFLPNLIPRLLEQGASSALLIYPIFNIERAYRLEHMLKGHLESHIQDIGSDINKIVLRSPTRIKEKVEDFLYNWDRVDRSLLFQIARILENSELKLSEDKIDFSLIETKVNSFLANYKAPPYHKDFKIASSNDRFRGEVVGFRGSVIFLENKIVVDMKKLRGYVLRGQIKCPVF